VNSHVVGKVPRLARAAAFTMLCIAGGIAVSAMTAGAQERTIQGRVVDADGNAPVPGAAVTVVGTALGAITNDSGQFHIRVPSTAVTLSARRIGYTPRSVPLAADQGEVTIGLIKDVLELEATVVTGTATSISSRNAANAVTVLNADQINQVPAPTLEDAMQGKIPGAIIQQNNGGAPGGGMQIQIRGVTSINSDASALYVIDGVPVNNGHINDGANAISGANDNTITQSTQDNPANRIADINPEDIESIEILKGASAAAQYGSRAGGGVVLITTKKGTPGKAKWDLEAKGGSFVPENELNLRQFPTAASAEAWYNQYEATPSNPWNPSRYMGNNPMQTQLFGGGQASYEGDLSVRGQSGQTQYYASLLSKYDNGLMVNTGYNKQGGRVNLTQNFSEAITGNLNMYFAHSNDRRGITGNDNVGISPYDVFSTTPTFFNQTARTATGGYINNPYGLANAYQDGALIQTPEEVSRFIGGGNVDARIFQTERQSLHLTALAGADLAHQTDDFYAPPDIEIEEHQPLPGVATNLNGDNTYLNYNVNLVHHYAGGNNFDATTSIGIGRDQRYLYNPYSVGQELPPGIAQVTAGAVQHNYDTTVVSRTFDVYAQEQFMTLDQRLTLSAGLTAERATDNGNINTYYPYPKFSGSFRIPQFAGFLDELKVRAAWGRSGTDPIFGVRYANVDNLTPQLDQGVTGLFTPESSNDPGIKPETNTEIETGFDATMFSSRAQFSATVYQKRITDLLLQASIPASSGNTTQWLNGGQFTDRGIELSLDVTPIQMQKGLTWIFTTTFYRNYSVVDQIPVPAFSPATSFGPAFGQYWVQQGRSLTEFVNTNTACGNGCYLQTGDVAPSYTMSFGNTFNLGRLRLYGLLDWQRGGNIGNLTNAYFDPNGLYLLADSAAEAARNKVNAAGGPAYVESASFLKLREITLSYGLPDRWVNAVSWVRLSSARLQVSGRNLWSSFPYTGLDPEVSNFGTQNIGRGQDVTPYPPSKSVFVSLDLGF
jgi:TonB-dependent starch-binding outer membrane protein SusC